MKAFAIARMTAGPRAGGWNRHVSELQAESSLTRLGGVP